MSLNDDRILHPGSVVIRIVYEDLPDLIELQTHVFIRDWVGTARAYTSPESLVKEADALSKWTYLPEKEFRIEAGEDTGIGWLVLRFRTIDMAGHIVCHVTLAARSPVCDGTKEVWRFAVYMPTEIGLVDRFANELSSLARTLKGEAILEGVLQ